jgi:hypothetical protein
MENRLADNFKRIGFRKWYERQLLSSHAHMVLAFLSAIGIIGSMEAFHTGGGDAQFVNAMFVVASAGIGVWALRRYLYLLLRAEQTANQASCPDCGDYGRFRVVGQRPRLQEIDVSCRKCQRGWVITPHQ